MKRCPQCEFIYEDDQSLCDMDGVLLVFDSRTLPNVHALATVPAPLPRKARRNRMVPAFATLLLMLVVGSVYYVSTLRNSAQNEFSPASVTSTTAEAAAEAPAVPSEPTPDTNQAQLAPAEPTEDRAAEPGEAKASPAPAKPAAAPAGKPATKPAATLKPEPKKEDSKVESILKKTGKILKKPFKF